MMNPEQLMPMINDKVKQLLGEQAMQIAVQQAQIEHLTAQLKELEAKLPEPPKPNGKDKKHGDLSTGKHDA